MILLDSIREAIEEKSFTREHIESIPNFKKTREYKSIPYVVCGRSSIANMTNKHKYVAEKSWKYTGPEMAREYLKMISRESGYNRKTLGYSRKTLAYLDLYAPMYFGGKHKGPLSYIDIVSAYAQLYMPMTLDMTYCLEDSFCGRGKIDFLWSSQLITEKRMRNSIMGSIKSTELVHAKYGKERTIRKRSEYLAPDLWGYVIHTMHAIAVDMKNSFKERVRYINTDGYIVDLCIKDLVLEFLWEKWGMDCMVKGESNNAILSGFGSFKVGMYKSMHLYEGGKPFENLLKLSQENIEKLRRWRFWALGYGRAD